MASHPLIRVLAPLPADVQVLKTEYLGAADEGDALPATTHWLLVRVKNIGTQPIPELELGFHTLDAAGRCLDSDSVGRIKPLRALETWQEELRIHDPEKVSTIEVFVEKAGVAAESAAARWFRRVLFAMILILSLILIAMMTVGPVIQAWHTYAVPHPRQSR